MSDKEIPEDIIKEVNRRLKQDFRREADLDMLVKNLGEYIVRDMQTKFTIPSEQHYDDHHTKIPMLCKWAEAKIKQEEENN